ncbi:MAG: hypothetical protein LBQ47_04915 [Endomicrobium sp.]|jgi:hypothetical protein|nr:hypothetical protein [Endomicrobium sp.]
MQNRKGSILAVVTIFVFIFMLLGMFSMRIIVMQQSASDAELYFTRTHYAALYTSEKALFKIMQLENIANDTTPAGAERKFLQTTGSCLGYSGGKWYPLTSAEIAATETELRDTSFGENSGIVVECSVEEELTPSANDGFIAGTTEATAAQRANAANYGTYKYYVIRSMATLYNDVNDHSKGFLSQANDNLHFVITYSSGPLGVSPKKYEEVDYPDGSDDINWPIYVRSAYLNSVFTQQPLPMHRYFVRGRR